MLGDRHESSPRPLSPLRNAPPRGLEAHNYLSADHSSGSSAAARRRAQHAHDHAQQSQVSFAEVDSCKMPKGTYHAHNRLWVSA